MLLFSAKFKPHVVFRLFPMFAHLHKIQTASNLKPHTCHSDAKSKMFGNGDFKLENAVDGLGNSSQAVQAAAFRAAVPQFSDLLLDSSSSTASTSSTVLVVVQNYEIMLSHNRRGDPRSGVVKGILVAASRCAGVAGKQQSGLAGSDAAHDNSSSNSGWSAVRSVTFLDSHRDSAIVRLDSSDHAKLFISKINELSDVAADFAKDNLPDDIGAANWGRYALPVGRGDALVSHGLLLQERSFHSKRGDTSNPQIAGSAIARASTSASWLDKTEGN